MLSICRYFMKGIIVFINQSINLSIDLSVYLSICLFILSILCGCVSTQIAPRNHFFTSVYLYNFDILDHRKKVQLWLLLACREICQRQTTNDRGVCRAQQAVPTLIAVDGWTALSKGSNPQSSQRHCKKMSLQGPHVNDPPATWSHHWTFPAIIGQIASSPTARLRKFKNATVKVSIRIPYSRTRIILPRNSSRDPTSSPIVGGHDSNQVGGSNGIHEKIHEIPPKKWNPFRLAETLGKWFIYSHFYEGKLFLT